MTPTRIETVPLANGTELRLTLAEPDLVTRGGLVVLHEAHGVTDRTRWLTSALAAEGWLTATPHLYHRHGIDEVDDPDHRPLIEQLSVESIMDDTDAAFGWLACRGVPADRHGVIGIEIGGTAALVVAAGRRLGAVVTIGGVGILTPPSNALPALVDIAGELACPWLGLYGDDPASAEEVEKLHDAAAGAGVATDAVCFSGRDHRFDIDSAATGEAWQRTRNWFDLHLR
jgi:carboxymethylenebutenolidase